MLYYAALGRVSWDGEYPPLSRLCQDPNLHTQRTTIKLVHNPLRTNLGIACSTYVPEAI
ncbi:hypothetical protein L873DRAFT_1822750 [Choiromyces venosus 120613-1]|uniref:Uncharacterized protein n=1 Tax=Choiromyces venosus 120613-1 TaxID=1336337 RepID=A0A3N4IYV5_9PEZI|nr:hypothetical protein L873DRAFT_1822750 [Choiromyces venosus 120613-1]